MNKPVEKSLCIHCNKPLYEEDIEVGSDIHEACLANLRETNLYNSLKDIECPFCKTLGKVSTHCFKCDAQL